MRDPVAAAPSGADRSRATRVRWSALALALAGLAANAQAAAPAQAGSLADCDAPGFDRVLVAPPGDAPGIEARAYWLSRELIAWPAAGGPGVYALHASRDGQLRLRPDGHVQSADERIELAQAGTIPAAVQARFRFVGDGARLALPADAVTRLPRLLEGELLLTREERGRVVASTRLQLPGALDDLYAADANDPAPLGAVASAAGPGVAYAAWAPTARALSVCRYANDTGAAAAITPMARVDGRGTWRLRDAAAVAGSYYLFLADVYVPGVGVVRNRVSDPWATGVGADSHRSQALDLDAPALAPAGWRDDRAPATVRGNADMAIYELHVRDFSISDASVPAAHRGKYLAFTDRDSRGMRHLRALADSGLTDVHLLPVFDFATVPETGCITPDLAGAPDGESQQAAASAAAARDCFNWGYDPVHYSAPEGSYASDAHDGAVRVREFRAMVQALHAAGLRVGMDVVYNHLTASGQRENAVLDRLVPGYYHRLDDKGVVARSTCCDNTATEHAMMARLMLDSVSLWARAYHVDSFRFDLMGHQTRAAMEALRDRLQAETGRAPNLIGEGWNFGEVASGARFVQASQLSLNGSGIGSFSDRGRDAARGGSAGDSGAAMLDNQGWLNGLVYAPNGHGPARKPEDLLRAADMVRVGLAGTLRSVRMPTFAGDTRALADIAYGDQPAGFASAPSEVVNYVENHDNQTLFDIDALRLPRDTTAADRARVQVLGMALTAFSQGVAYFHAGIDVLRSKSLDRNSFDSGDGFNRLDWTYTDNGFGHGLPPKQDNGKDWALLQPLLADAAIKPAPADIAFARDAFRDLLRIRASTPLFRLDSAAEVQKRLSFPNAGPAQNPVVVAGLLDGRGRGNAVFDEVLYFVNASPKVQALVLPELAGRGYVLHPVLAAAQAADRARLAQAQYQRASGRFEIPPRTAVVYVLPRTPSAEIATQ